jgi:antirestriction protein ArdC
MTSIPACEALVQQMHDAPTLRHGEDRAWYSSASDVVNMPHKDLFHTPEEYYSTLFHELIHSTGHMRRLARPGITDCCPFGSTNYSKEELVAEMGATFLSSLTGIDNLTIDNSAAYVQGWIAKLRNDRRILVQAGAAAQRAVDYITDADPSASNCQAELESSA